jgi:hypothetical protein
VITGFGRLGAWFASALWNLEPDLITMAKGITSGYVPLGATMVSEAMTDTFERGGYLAHGFTYSGHPVATAAGLANRHHREGGWSSACATTSARTSSRKLRALAGHPAVGEIRGEQLIAPSTCCRARQGEAADAAHPRRARRRPRAQGRRHRARHPRPHRRRSTAHHLGTRSISSSPVSRGCSIACGSDPRETSRRSRHARTRADREFVPALGYHWLTRSTIRWSR